MKIAYIILKGMPLGGGIEKYTEELGTRLAMKEHEIIVVSECIYNQFCKPGCRLREDKVLDEVKTYLASYPCILIY